MQDELFTQLLASVREGGAILQGQVPASRINAIEVTDPGKFGGSGIFKWAIYRKVYALYRRQRR